MKESSLGDCRREGFPNTTGGARLKKKGGADTGGTDPEKKKGEFVGEKKKKLWNVSGKKKREVAATSKKRPDIKWWGKRPSTMGSVLFQFGDKKKNLGEGNVLQSWLSKHLYKKD